MALRNLCEAYQAERRQKSEDGMEMLCSVHHEKLKLFCLDDQQPVCLVCRDSRKHTNHRFCPLEEALSDNREKLKVLLIHLHEKLVRFEDLKSNLEQSAGHIKTQVQQTMSQITQEFQKLHQILRDEEEACLTALREEEEQKSLKIQQKMEETSKEMVSLTQTLSNIEEQMKADDDAFLQNIKTTLQSAQGVLSDSENNSDMLINVPKHLSNLMQRMLECVEYTPVTLDPNTAHCKLLVSDNLSSVQFSEEKHLLPDNLERFDCRECVLGSEGFDSGIHLWDVEVGDNTNWSFGVMTESAKRKDDMLTRKGLWVLGYISGEYYAFVTPKQSPPLSVKKKLQRVRVQLNCDGGKLSFSDPLTNTHIYTFTQKFSEKVYPWFGVCCSICPLSILPVT